MSMSDALSDSASTIVHYLKPFWRDYDARRCANGASPWCTKWTQSACRMDSVTDLTPDQYQEISAIRAERVVEMATDERDTFIDDDIPEVPKEGRASR